MPQPILSFSSHRPLVVGSFGSMADLLDCTPELANASCEVVEIRLDILYRDGWKLSEKPWAHLAHKPLLFTARCQSEGGVMSLDVATRAAMIEAVCGEAAAVDVEIASMHEMRDSLALLAKRSIPWVASSHHFAGLPTMELWRDLRDRAWAGGASVAKFAATLHDAAEIQVLETFQSEAADISVSTMGMGELAPASRVRCALAGSVLNYGFIGQAPTAPGQWPAATLRAAIHEKTIPSL
jgi:3-dehydroquinate dehydratase-1